MSIQPKLNNNQRRIGLTGGIACGKSTIANYIKKNKNIPILDADLFSKELIKPSNNGYKAVIAYFGNQIVDNNSTDKEINRELLKKIIFNNSKHRKWIQNLLHPLIKEKMIERCNQLEKNKILLLVVPLLFEAKFTDLCTEIWLVKCPKAIQKKRLIKRNMISDNEAEKIINIQQSFEEKSRFADVILDNSEDQKLWTNTIEKLI
tara:strand:+ start:790 stop:1404 length:615 start_codon:yes stop_codon:yes gene_type:complete